MVDEAHGEVKLALQELRDLARGIHPAVLTDRGLDAALSSVASRCTVPVTVSADLPARPGRGDRGHRVLHGLRAPPERQQAQRGTARVGRRVAVRRPADDPGLGRRDGRGAARRRYGHGGAGGPAGRGRRAVRPRLPRGRPHDGHGRAALARPGRDRGAGGLRAGDRGGRTAGRSLPGPGPDGAHGGENPRPDTETALMVQDAPAQQS